MRMVLAAMAAMLTVWLAPEARADEVIAPGVVLRPVDITTRDGARVRGVVVAPAKAARKAGPGVLFVHWLGDPATTNNTEFRADAVALAQQGATSLLVDAMWSERGWMKTMGHAAEDDRGRTLRQLADLKAALGVLAAQPGVDKRRIAYVGHDFGAMFGALVAGSDPRPKWYVLMAATTALPTWYTFHTRPADMSPWDRAFADLDLLAALQRSKAADMLFQFSARDDYLTRAQADALSGAAPGRKTVFFYDAAHSLETPKAHEDRIAWLKARIF